jgi:hypothetical protein
MTNHKATPEQWAQVEEWADNPRSSISDACILELRARVKVLEELVHELQTMHNTAVEWKMEQDYRLNELEDAATPPGLRPRVHTVTVVATPTAGGGPPVKAVEAEAAQPQPAPAGSLVERIADVFLNKSFTADDPIGARAAIREVAAWLRVESEGHFGSELLSAQQLEQEAEQ